MIAPAPVHDVLLQALAAADADGVTKHVVGAVITDDTGRVLLLHRPASDFFGDMSGVG